MTQMGGVVVEVSLKVAATKSSVTRQLKKICDTCARFGVRVRRGVRARRGVRVRVGWGLGLGLRVGSRFGLRDEGVG